MTVSADVLNWCGAGEARDFAESLDAGEASVGGEFDYIVPEFAAHGFDGGGFGRDATHTINNNYTIETFVVADSISATAKHKSGEIISFSETIGIGNFFGFFDF